MAPYVDDFEVPKYIYLYHYTFSVKRYRHHGKSAKESVYGIIAAHSEVHADERIRSLIIEKRLSQVTGAVEATTINKVAITPLDIDEIALPLKLVGDSYLHEVLRLVGMQKKAA